MWLEALHTHAGAGTEMWQFLAPGHARNVVTRNDMLGEGQALGTEHVPCHGRRAELEEFRNSVLGGVLNETDHLAKESDEPKLCLLIVGHVCRPCFLQSSN